jgi:HAD superfamily hydrolase (TIGR01509 family)
MSVLTTLIFDVDGTLADTEANGHRPAFNSAFKDANLAWHWDADLYGKLLKISGGKERMQHYIDNYQAPVPFAWQGEIVQRLSQLHQAKTAHYLKLLKTGGIPLRPGIARLLKEAHKQKVTLAIATTTTEDNVRVLLEQTLGKESLNWFSIMATANQVPKKKPAPDVYHYVLEKLKVSAEHCLAFEDSGNGLAAATAAGIKTFITPTAYTAQEDFSHAWAIAAHLGDTDLPTTWLKPLPSNSLPRLVDLASLQQAFFKTYG